MTEGRVAVDAADQQILTIAVLREAGVTTSMLWVHYLSVGGSRTFEVLTDYIAGFRVLPLVERDRVSQALNELIMGSPRLLQAPSSDAP